MHIHLLEHLKRRESTSQEHGPFITALVALAQHISDQAEAHLKLVIAQHEEFDLHDGSHSAHVASNIQAILGPTGIAGRSAPDLFLLHLSAYLHDCAMALPEWELNLLKLTEGPPKPDETPQSPKNDLKPVLGFEAASDLVRSHLATIFDKNKVPLDWIFASPTEDEFIIDLTERLREYQAFRNGHTRELRALQSDSSAYAKRSDELRRDFIRRTHPARVDSWIRNLARLFESRLGGAWGRALAYDLATICRSHGEDGEFVRRLPTETIYYRGARSNPQLVALLLRVADIVDFCADRAPSILLREKLIKSPVSRDHWDVKNEGITYSFETDNDGLTVVRYSAYFQKPRLYFLFQDYLDWVDGELLLYSQLTKQRGFDLKAPDRLPEVCPRANRTGIRYDAACFEPVHGLRFSLDQRRILELLMGVKLYLTEDPDYVRGVKEGWSILFLGDRDTNNICRPGIVPRLELAGLIPQSFWTRNQGLEFSFLDGERLIAV